MIQSLKGILDKYKDYKWFSDLDLVEDAVEFNRVDSEKEQFVPRIVFIGEFSVGKSSIINNILNRNILPIGWQPETKYVTEIKYSSSEYIMVDEKKLELTTENIKNIVTNSNKIEIFMKEDILKQVILIDTPGTNDPTNYSDDIVFNVVSSSDAVLFITKANQALTNSEKLFLSRLVKAKDLEKFFFIINFADVVDERKLVKNEFINNLSSLLGLDRDTLQKNTYLYSVKEKELYANVLTGILEIINSKKSKVLKEWEKREKSRIIGNMLIKIQYLIDSIDGNVSKYDEELKELREQIQKVEEYMDKEMKKFEMDIEQKKQTFIQELSRGFEGIKLTVTNEINNMDLNQIINSRYVELRLRKLVEDLIENEWDRLLKSINKLNEEFNNKIDTYITTSSLTLLVSPSKPQSGGFIKVATSAGAIGATLATIPASGAILSSIVSGALPGFLSFILSPLAGGVGVALGTVFVVLNFGNFYSGFKRLLDKGVNIIDKQKEKLEKHNLINSINNQLDQQLKYIISEIQKKIDLNEFKKQYIAMKFPQKQALEEKIKLLNTRKITQYQNSQKVKNEVLQLYQDLEDLQNEL